MQRIDASPSVSLRRVRAALAISRERMARLLDVTTKTVARLEEQDRLPARSAAAARLARIQEIVDLGPIVFTADGFIQFMSTPSSALHGLTALQLIERDEAEQVFGALASLYDGNPA